MSALTRCLIGVTLVLFATAAHAQYQGPYADAPQIRAGDVNLRPPAVAPLRVIPDVDTTGAVLPPGLLAAPVEAQRECRTQVYDVGGRSVQVRRC